MSDERKDGEQKKPGQSGNPTGVKQRTELQRERDLVKITNWYCEGRSQIYIADQLKISRTQVQDDLAEIRKRWAVDRNETLQEYIHRELAKIDRLEAEAWVQYYRCLKPEIITTYEHIEADDKRAPAAHVVEDQPDGESDSEAAPSKQKVPGVLIRKRVKTHAMHEKWMNHIEWCIDQRCKILGLFKPTKVAWTDTDGDDLPVNNLTDEQLQFAVTTAADAIGQLLASIGKAAGGTTAGGE